MIVLAVFALFVIAAIVFGYEFVKTRALGTLGMCLTAIAFALLNLPNV